MIGPIFSPLWPPLFPSSPFLTLLQPYWPPRCSSGQTPPAPGLLHFPWSGIVFSLISGWLTLLPPAASRLCCDALFFFSEFFPDLAIYKTEISPFPWALSMPFFFCCIFHYNISWTSDMLYIYMLVDLLFLFSLGNVNFMKTGKDILRFLLWCRNGA